VNHWQAGSGDCAALSPRFGVDETLQGAPDGLRSGWMDRTWAPGGGAATSAASPFSDPRDLERPVCASVAAIRRPPVYDDSRQTGDGLARYLQRTGRESDAGTPAGGLEAERSDEDRVAAGPVEPWAEFKSFSKITAFLRRNSPAGSQRLECQRAKMRPARLSHFSAPEPL